MRVGRWPLRRPRVIRPLWWRVGLVLWAVVALLGVRTLAVRVDWAALAASAPAMPRLFGSPSAGTGPDFTLHLLVLDGGTFHLADQRGKVVVINFWASWCVPCRTEMPRLAAASQAYGNRGVVFVGVDVNDPPENARAFLREFGIGYPNGPDQDLTIAERYDVTGLPATFVVDREGRIRQRWQGEIQAD